MRTHPFMIRESFSLPEGPVEILFPDILSPESVGEVAEWLHLLERKLRRWSASAIEIAEHCEKCGGTMCCALPAAALGGKDGQPK